MKFAKKSLAVFLCSAFIVACSGSDGGSAATVPTQSMAKIDAANAASIAGDVVNAMSASRNIGDILSGGGSGSLTGNADSGFSKPSGSNPGGSLGHFAAVPIPATNALCAVDGSATITGQIADPATLSAGDRLNFEFFDCDDGNDKVLNGVYEIVVNIFSGDVSQGSFSLDATVTFDAFEIAQGSGTTALNGVTTVNLDTSVAPITSVAVSGVSLSVGDGTDSATLAEFRNEVTHNAGVAPEVYTMAASGTLTSTLFEGSVNYSTPAPFQGFVNEFPFPGELLVTGADGASLKLMALDSTNVRLEIDSGDGSEVVTQDTTWFAVVNAIGANATGITGQVLWGPIVPGPEAPGQVNEAPFSAFFNVLDAADNAVARFESDDDGNFTVLLAPGEYTIVPDASTPMPNPEQQRKSVTAPASGFTDVVLRFDTGIR